MPFNILLTHHTGAASQVALRGSHIMGKVAKEASKVQVFSDATITVPVVVQALKAAKHKRNSYPAFDWSGTDLVIQYERR